MDMKKTYPSRWWMPDDFDNIGTTFKIGNVRMENVGAGFRPCMFFHGVEKGLVIWEATSKAFTEALGSSETNDWVGREVELYSFDGTNAQTGKVTKRLGVRLPDVKAPAPVAKPYEPPRSLRDELNDDVPF